MTMRIVRLSSVEAADTVEALESARYEILVAYDEMDHSFKVKIDGGTWSPPMGEEYE